MEEHTAYPRVNATEPTGGVLPPEIQQSETGQRRISYPWFWLNRIRQFLELIRFSHTLFALPFAALSAVMVWSERPFRWHHLLGFLLCMVFARSAAMAFNRLVDRDLDALNPRTAGRHLPRGILGVRQVWIFTVCCAIGFVVSTLLFLPNYWPLVASGPVLAFLFAYSYSKRFTPLSHFWLGMALALAPPGVWLAIQGQLAWPPIILGAAVVFWVAGFDIIYACQDYDFDRQQKLWSVPAVVGVRTALWLAACSHAVMVLCLAALPFFFAGFDWLYWCGMILVALLLIYEHVLVRPNDLRRVNEAFFHVNAVVSVGLLIIGIVDIWLL